MGLIYELCYCFIAHDMGIASNAALSCSQEWGQAQNKAWGGVWAAYASRAQVVQEGLETVKTNREKWFRFFKIPKGGVGRVWRQWGKGIYHMTWNFQDANWQVPRKAQNQAWGGVLG